VGQAGTGKTLLALAAGLELTIHQKLFKKILVTRPIMPLGNLIFFPIPFTAPVPYPVLMLQATTLDTCPAARTKRCCLG
jgi:hypothetical protein